MTFILPSEVENELFHDVTFLSDLEAGELIQLANGGLYIKTDENSFVGLLDGVLLHDDHFISEAGFYLVNVYIEKIAKQPLD